MEAFFVTYYMISVILSLLLNIFEQTIYNA
jgi:hypothetical protein